MGPPGVWDLKEPPSRNGLLPGEGQDANLC